MNRNWKLSWWNEEKCLLRIVLELSNEKRRDLLSWYAFCLVLLFLSILAKIESYFKKAFLKEELKSHKVQLTLLERKLKPCFHQAVRFSHFVAFPLTNPHITFCLGTSSTLKGGAGNTAQWLVWRIITYSLTAAAETNPVMLLLRSWRGYRQLAYTLPPKKKTVGCGKQRLYLSNS